MEFVNLFYAFVIYEVQSSFVVFGLTYVLLKEKIYIGDMGMEQLYISLDQF